MAANYQLTEFPNSEEFISNSADTLASYITQYIEDQGFCSVILAGGGTPMPVYRKLAEKDINWGKVYFFFGDERFVDRESDKNNYHQINEHFFQHIDIPTDNIFWVPTELDIAECCAAYDITLDSFLKERSAESFDIVLFGIGPDGHIASLFPNTEALFEEAKWVVPNHTTEFDVEERITLTYPALLNSKKHIFLLNGSKKKEIWEKTVAAEGDFQHYPAQKILAEEKSEVWACF